MERIADQEKRQVPDCRTEGTAVHGMALHFRVAMGDWTGAIAALSDRCIWRRFSLFRRRQDAITAESRAYIAKHPQLQQILHDFTTAV